MKARTLSVLWAIFISVFAVANSGRLYPSDRLSSGLITCICQDRYGYIWIGTEYGLNKFDGYRFIQYQQINGDTASIAGNDIASLYVGSDGTLWVGCTSGLSRYDYETNSFHNYRFPDDREPRVNALQESADGKLYIGTPGYGLYSIAKGNSWIDYEGKFNRMAPNQYFDGMFIDREGCLWQSSQMDGLNRFILQGDRPVSVQAMKTEQGRPVSFIDYTSDAMLIVCSKGILRYSYKTRLLTDAGFDMTVLGDNVSVSTAFLSRDGHLFIGTTSNGLMMIAPGEKSLTRVDNTNRDIELRLTNVSAISEDRSGNLWLGCYGKGLLTVNKEQEAFSSWSFAQQNMRSGGSISSIAAAGDGGILCTVEPGGVYKMNAQGRITDIKSAPSDAHAIYRDKSGRYWLGTDNTLYQFLPEKGTFVKKGTYEGRGITTIIGDDEGKLYLGLFGVGLCIYDPETGKDEILTMQQADRPGGYLCNNWINMMCTDSDGNLWIATSSGVAMMKPKGRVFNSMGWNNLLEGKQCYSICQTADKDMLIGTNSGLYVYRRKTNKVELLDHSDPLQDKFICSMIPDPNTSAIWISTTKGIWEYDSKKGSMVAHVNGNGLVSKEYTLGAGLYSDGKIYFGTNDGVTSFEPDVVRKNQRSVSDVHLTAISVNGRPLNPMQNRFELSYQENSFALEFSLLDFRNPEDISFEWRINGSAKWQEKDQGDNRLILSELQPGVYDIEVRAKNNGLLSETPMLVRIIIDKPWYKSAMAYFLYLLLAVGIGALLLYNYERQRRRDLEETKMQFLINATHDIRSPLTLIMGALGKLKNIDMEDIKLPVSTIDKNAQRLLLLVNQILDERKIDKGQMRLSCRETDLCTFVSGIYSLYEYNARQRNINYNFEHPDQPLMVWIDRVNFDKVVSNLLSNAFKYTFDGGDITVRISEKGGSALIEVIDSGMGFEDDRTERFFERFYQGKNSKGLLIDGTGIGLNLSRAITELHGGTIHAQNRKGGQRGAILTVSLPLGNKHLKPEFIEVTANNEEPADEVVSQSVKPNSGIRVLLVDDDREIAQYISYELGQWYRFDYAENGRTALKELLTAKGLSDGQPPYHLVISDVMMPEMDGITLLRSIKQNPQISHIPVILLTSKADVAYRLEGLKRGADAYLAKPFNMEELHITIDNLISNVRRLKGKFTKPSAQEVLVQDIKVKGNDEVLMEKIMKVVNAHLSDSDLCVDTLTKEVGISRAQLHRKMKELTGVSTSEFIRNLRLEQAARLIREKKLNISQVTYSVGFNNQAHFSTVFKKYFGVTPTEYADTKTDNYE